MKRRGALVGIVMALAVAVTACGGGGNQAAVSIKTLQAAVSRTQAAESSRFTMDVSIDVAGAPLTLTAAGVMSGDGKNGEMTISMPIVGSIAYRVVDGVMYMDMSNIPGADAELDGKHWVKVDPEQLADRGMLDDLADQAQSNSPQQGLEYLQGLSGDVQDLGEDTVAGRPATHYRASIDYPKLLEKLPHATDEMREAFAKLGTVPADVWIDGQDRVVKMHMTIDASAFGAGTGTGTGTAELTMQITDFGVSVDVQAPPADDTVDISELSGLES